MPLRVPRRYRCPQGGKLRAKLHAFVPKGHRLRPPVVSLVEGALKPKTAAQCGVGLDMLRRVAVANQLEGRREFSARHVVDALEGHPKEMMLWLSLNKDEAGVGHVKARAHDQPTARSLMRAPCSSPVVDRSR